MYNLATQNWKAQADNVQFSFAKLETNSGEREDRKAKAAVGSARQKSRGAFKQKTSACGAHANKRKNVIKSKECDRAKNVTKEESRKA